MQNKGVGGASAGRRTGGLPTGPIPRPDAHLGLEADAVLEGVLVVQGDAEVVPVVHQVVLGLSGHGGPEAAGLPLQRAGHRRRRRRTSAPSPDRPRGGDAPPRSAEQGRGGDRSGASTGAVLRAPSSSFGEGQGSVKNEGKAPLTPSARCGVCSGAPPEFGG